MTIGILKEIAKAKLRGKRLLATVGFVLALVIWTTVAQIYITVFGFETVFSIIEIAFTGFTGFRASYLLLPVLLILLFLLGDMLHMSYRWFGLDLVEDKENVELKDVFQGFFKDNRTKLFSLIVVRALIVLAWSLLLIIPGIWKAYLYSQAANNLKKDKSLSPMEALKQSEEQMKGNILKYVLLQLTFAPWYIVPIGLFVFFIWTNTYEIQVGLEMGAEGTELILGVVLAILFIVGVVLLLFALYVEPYKMTSKQVFYEEMNKPNDESPYDEFEQELLKKQGLDRRDRPVTPRF
ncbi:DUF975 family protein [Alkalibacterium iburiense]|uniref:DUF975 family protein n=1 Tax=Alkalibacterium iburiense TaxID=290589 RepID=A0ABN0XA13_9LACT